MNKFTEEQQKLLKELVNNSRKLFQNQFNIRNQEKKYLKQLNDVEDLNRKGKVLPFYENTADLEQIPDTLKNEAIQKEQYEEFDYRNNFYKRYIKVLFYILTIQKQKDAIQNENDIWMDYLIMMMFYQFQSIIY